jgi:predicted nucleic acid-binding protein
MSASRRTAVPLSQTWVLGSEALSQAVRGHRDMVARLAAAHRKQFKVITSPMTLIEAHDSAVGPARWSWVISRMSVASIGKDEARHAQRLLTDAGLHGHKCAIDATLAVVALQQSGLVTVFTSDADDMEKLLPPTVLVRKI